MKDLCTTPSQEFFSARELAEMARDRKVVGFPVTESGVIRHARQKGWDDLGQSLCRKRPGRGGGREYHFSLLPQTMIDGLHITAIGTQLQARQETQALEDRRKIDALRAHVLPARARAVMEARSEVLLAIEGYAVAEGEKRAWAIAQFLAAQEAWAEHQDLEARRDAHLPLTERDITRLALPLILITLPGFGLSIERLTLANDRKDSPVVKRATIYDWFKTRDERGVVALAPAATKAQKPIPAAFFEFLPFYAKPTKPSLADAHREYLKAAEARDGVQLMVLSLSQVEYIMRTRLNVVEKMVGREGFLTLRSRLPYVTRTFDDMLPTTVYSADGKTFDAEIADPVTKRPIRPEITTVIDVPTRKIVGISLARSENQRSVAEALRNSCSAHGICAIFYVDRGPGYRNEAMDADVAGLMGRLGITKMHAKAYGSQAKGVIERPNNTVWDTLAKRLPTYIGKDMDKEAGDRIHKLTRQELKLFGESRALPSWEEFVRLCWAMVEEYNAKPHTSLPKFEDPKTGKKRHMSPDEFWAAYVANGFEPVPVDPEEADDLFRPYEIRTVRRGQVQWNGNFYFHPSLERLHDEKVMVGYDYHQAEKVWVRKFDRSTGQPGPLVCVALFMGNAERYVPLSYEQKAQETRSKARLARLGRKVEDVEAERQGIYLIEQAPLEPAPFLDAVAQEVVEAPVEAPAAVEMRPRRKVFQSDEELAIWALDHPSELNKNQISVLKSCLGNPSARELFRLSGIDVEALRILLRAVA